MKRALCDESNDLKFDVSVVLLDIEGTTTSIKFVKETLFPYVVEEVEAHFRATWSTDETQQDVKDIRAQIAKDAEANSSGTPAEDTSVSGDATDTTVTDAASIAEVSGDVTDTTVTDAASIAEVSAAVKKMVAEDRKIGCLKTLQGHMWRRGYAEGQLKGHVFEDVPPALRSWRAAGARLFIYSSGSVEAQRLLFGHTEHGDLNTLFSGNYDTSIGPKTEAGSYSAIAEDMAVPPHTVLFVTDIAAEARAARECGMQVLLSVRPGNVSGLQDGEEYPCTTSFSDVSIVSSNHTSQNSDKKSKS